MHCLRPRQVLRCGFFFPPVVFLAMLCPLNWIQRSMFEEIKEEKNRSAIVSGIYLTLVLVAFWFLSRQAF